MQAIKDLDRSRSFARLAGNFKDAGERINNFRTKDMSKKEKALETIRLLANIALVSACTYEES